MRPLGIYSKFRCDPIENTVVHMVFLNKHTPGQLIRKHLNKKWNPQCLWCDTVFFFKLAIFFFNWLRNWGSGSFFTVSYRPFGVYLGSLLSADGCSTAAIARRIGEATGSYGKLVGVWRKCSMLASFPNYRKGLRRSVWRLLIETASMLFKLHA